MFRSVFLKELYDERRRLPMSAVTAGLGCFLMMQLWPSIADIPNIDEFLAQYPEAMKDLFNIEGITTGAGFLNAELFSFLIPGLFLIFGINRGAALAGEEELGRLELILVTPVSRIRFAMEKAAALTVSTMILGLVIFAFLWLAIIMVDADVPITELAAAMTAVTLLGMEHGLVAMAVGLATGRKSWAVATASMMALGGYVLYAAGEFLSSIQRYQMLSPIFHALEGGPVGGGFRVSLIFMPLIGVLALALTLHRFDVRDIRT